MAQTAHRSQIPVASSPAPPSPSAFPPMPSSSASANGPAPATPTPSRTARPESNSGIPSYAGASKQFLPQPPKSSALARIQPSSTGPASPYSRPAAGAEEQPAKQSQKTATKNKRMSLPVQGAGKGGAAGKKGAAGKGPAAARGPGSANSNQRHARSHSEQHLPLPKPLSPRSSPLSALAPTFAFRPTAPSFQPSAPLAPPIVPATAEQVAAEHLSPLAPTFQPTSPLLGTEPAAEPASTEEIRTEEATTGLGLSKGEEETKATPPSPSFKEMAIEAEDEAAEDGEGAIAEQAEPKALGVEDKQEVKEMLSEEPVVEKKEEPIVPQVTESTPLPEPLVHAIANKADEVEETSQPNGSHPEPIKEAVLPEPLIQATLNVDSSPAVAEQEQEPIPTSVEEIIAQPALSLSDTLDRASEDISQSATPEVSTPAEIELRKEEAEAKVEKAVEEVKKALEEKVEFVEERAEPVVEQVEEKAEEIKESVEEKVEQVKESAEPLVEQARQQAGQVVEAVEEKVEEAKESVEQAVENVEEKVEPFVEQAREKVEEVVEAVEEKAEPFVEQVKESVQDAKEWVGEQVEAAKDKVEEVVESIRSSTFEEPSTTASEPTPSPLPTPTRSSSSTSTWEPFEEIVDEAAPPAATSPADGEDRQSSADVAEGEEGELEDAGEGESTPTPVVSAPVDESTPLAASRSLPSSSTDADSAALLTRRSSSPPPPNDEEPTRDPSSSEAPSLTLSIVSAWRQASWAKKIPAILASIAINFGLPFVNGVMLGFGELFARNYIGVRLGWGNPFRAPSSTSSSSDQRANTATGVGLRANTSPLDSGRRDHPLHGGAGMRTAVEAVEEVVVAEASA